MSKVEQRFHGCNIVFFQVFELLESALTDEIVPRVITKLAETLSVVVHECPLTCLQPHVKECMSKLQRLFESKLDVSCEFLIVLRLLLIFLDFLFF